MPILADVVVDEIREDESRYRGMILSGELKSDGPFVHNGIGYQMYIGTDNYIASLASTRLITLFKGEDCVYSCYFKVAETPHFGKRVVQVEVRQHRSVRGMARAVMKKYFLRHYDAVRTDISNTRAGKKMWVELFNTERENLHFYHARLNIDVRTKEGPINQNGGAPEYPKGLKRIYINELPDAWWHSNRTGDVHVVYALKNPL